MLAFGLSFAAGVVALLAVQKMDVEYANPPVLKLFTQKRKAAIRVPTSGVLPGSAYLQQQ